MNRTELAELIRRKGSFLCVGLDTDPKRIPAHLGEGPEAVYAFNKAIIEATLPYAAAYKLNIAFYEAMGVKGWEVLERTIHLIPPGEALIIADAKRGDIGNTAARYGAAFFEALQCDAITVNPYMGNDSVTPFLDYAGKWTIILGLTSNVGAQDVELLKLENGKYVFEEVIARMAKLGHTDNTMFVIGATQTDYLERVRKIIPDHFLLVPGVGAQGGKLEDMAVLMNDHVGILVNSSRSIIYASTEGDFADRAADEAAALQGKMHAMLAGR
jgi:orotidine-5'-phosphate decarboxylase